MILAAGLGTRLRPLTDRTPKALVQVAGVPMIERVARRLVAAGADRLIVNVHHHPDSIEAFLEGLTEELGVEIAISREEERPLDTGGGLLLAEPLFRQDVPFFLHNVDVITDIDLGSLYGAHGPEAVATLAVHRRDTSRFLLFDEDGLYGWENAARGVSRTVRGPRGGLLRLGFAGIHVVVPGIFQLLEAAGYDPDDPFSILEAYLRLAAEGRRIAPHDVTGDFWIEIGNPERLARAEALLATR
jgi:NDP-sugar pyrophosphorylase family protein